MQLPINKSKKCMFILVSTLKMIKHEISHIRFPTNSNFFTIRNTDAMRNKCWV